MTIWFCSDFHMGHSRIIEYCNRPFANVDEMNEALIANHNALVQDTDEVWHLGDFSLSEHIVPLFLPRLNGNKHIVFGNHDRKAYGNKTRHLEAQKRYIEYGFKSVHMQHELEGFILNHLPFAGDGDKRKKLEPFRSKDDGYRWLLHGHSHNKLGKVHGRQIDVGVDVWNYKPVALEELIAIRAANG